MKSIIHITWHIFSVVLVTGILSGCANEIERRGPGGGPTTFGGPGSEDGTETSPLADKNGTIGMRNFRQLSGSLSSVTGVPTTTAQVITQLNNTQSSLSIDGDATKVNSASLLKSMELAAVYCLQSANNTALRTRVYGNFNFAATAAQVADSALQALAQSILNAFIPDSSVDPSVSEKIQVLVDMMKAIRTGAAAGAANATTITNMVVGGCTSVAASQGFIFLN
jgi:hypothetical protein